MTRLQDESNQNGVVRSLRSALLAILSIVAIAFIFWLAWQYRRDMIALLGSADPVWLSLGFLLLLGTNASGAAMFVQLTGREGITQADPLLVSGTFLVSQVAKYVPGRIWSVAMQAGIMAGLNVRALAIVNVELALIIVVCSIGLGVAALAWAHFGWFAGITVLALAVIVCGAALSAGVTRRLVDSIMRLLRRGDQRGTKQGQVASPTPIGMGRWVSSLLFVVSYFFGWLLLICGGLGFGLHEGLLLVSAQLLATAAGTISMLPGGLGVREGTMLAFTGWGELNASHLAMVAIATRLCILALDVVSAIIGLAMVARAGRRHS